MNEKIADEYALVRALFLRLVGLVYVLGFASLWIQIDGLVGSGGILPVEGFLAAVRSRIGETAWWALPTLCWLDASDWMLYLLSAAGLAAAMCAVVGAMPALALFAAWISYLSLVIAGQVFFSFQWDILLLETGFLSLLWAPLSIRPRWVWAEPSRIVLWLLRVLAFRLFFSSGLVKLISGDASWRELTALNFHYLTQPLPTWTSWYAHHLPTELQIFSTGAMFVIELAVPFCIFAPRRMRIWGAVGLIFLQVLIGLTGNYGFFNLLSAVLCLVLLDDRSLYRFSKMRPSLSPVRNWPRVFLWPWAALILLLGSFQLSQTAGLELHWPAAVGWVHGWCRPFYLVNSYGLFAVMTTSRPEIQIEGSLDGEEWRVYEFCWKPGALEERPSFVQPHMPRLDWQMWFAALRTYRDYPWFLHFMGALLEGKPAVSGLLAENPFPAGAPRYVRARLYDYRFATWESRRAGRWWERQDRGFYSPVLSLKEK